LQEIVNAEITRAEAEIQEGDSFHWRREYERIAKQSHHLTKEKDELASELENLSLSPEEARDRLLAKVKSDGAKNQQVQAMLKTLEQRLDELGNELQDIETDIEGIFFLVYTILSKYFFYGPKYIYFFQM
jgi:predicted nuclease with TOPRIM domain